MSPPVRLGGYELLDELARGGMGSVYRARAPTGELVAVKALHGLDAAQRVRFLEEARALLRVRDPGLVRLLGADLAGERPYLVMELVPGESLAARLRRHGPLDPRDAARIGLELARTLERLHAAGVAHRDLKPANVVLRPDGQPVLLDLGLALLLDRSARLTRSGTLMGTPGYMPPEQATGEVGAMGPASDVWGLGALLYGLLTGRGPFEGSDLLGSLQALMERPPMSPCALRPGLDPRLERVVLRCLTKAPPERPELEAVREELEAFLGDPAARRRGWPVVAGLGACAVAALLLAWTRTGPAPPAPAPVAPAPDRPAPPAEPSAPPAEPPAPRWTIGQQEALRLEQQGDLPGALAAAERALALDPDEAVLHAIRGSLLNRLDRLPEAEAALARAIELDPFDPRSRRERGAIRARLADPRGAIADLDKAIELDPDDAGTWANRGSAREADHDLRGAIRDWQRAAELLTSLGDAAGAERIRDWIADAEARLARGED